MLFALIAVLPMDWHDAVAPPTWSNWCLVFVGFGASIAALRSLKALRHQNQIAVDTAQRQLRAYVCLSGSQITFERTLPVAQIEIKNCGSTPAYDVRQWTGIRIEAHPLSVSLDPPPQGFNMSSAIIPPNGWHGMRVPARHPIPPHLAPLIGTPAGTIYVYGEVRYKDAFGHERFTRYRLIHGGTEGPLPPRVVEGKTVFHVKPDTEGNDAN